MDVTSIDNLIKEETIILKKCYVLLNIQKNYISHECLFLNIIRSLKTEKPVITLSPSKYIIVQLLLLVFFYMPFVLFKSGSHLQKLHICLWTLSNFYITNNFNECIWSNQIFKKFYCILLDTLKTDSHSFKKNHFHLNVGLELNHHPCHRLLKILSF